MTDARMQLVDWLDDLCVRFIVNLPHEELLSVERICFQIEEAQWFYEDFIRPLDPSLPSMNLRKFSMLMFQHCPLSSGYSELHHLQAYEDFLAYKTRVPVRGAIMLNEDMTQAVLVKGWKKNANWSFPRGKINKDEPDLDCAVREVYEETGYDLKAAGLVKSEEEMHKISVNMREQNMQLYVFRGVPMDTHFEPRTRKEISKIAWYNLADLPTIKKKHHVQQGTGADLVKENKFYMVAPFLSPLKRWIQQQRKLDKTNNTKSGDYLAPALVDDFQASEDTIVQTAAVGEAPVSIMRHADDNLMNGDFAQLVAKLGRSHRTSDALPEVTLQQQAPNAFDPAAELKKLLSVGGGLPDANFPVEAPATAQQPQTNPLLAMLQASSKSTPMPQPETPYEQTMLPPLMHQDSHGQHHPRTLHVDDMPLPPHLSFQPLQSLPIRGPHRMHMQPRQINNVTVPNLRNFIPPPPPQAPSFPAHPQNIQQAFSQQAPRPYQQTGDPQFAAPPHFPGHHGPAIPPASRLPPPKLTEHSLGLLNAFKSQDKPAAPLQLVANQAKQNFPDRQEMKLPPVMHESFDSYRSPSNLQSAIPYAPSPPPFMSPPQSTILEPVQPKPRSAHQDSLLNLFRSPSAAAVTPPPSKLGVEPVELSAQPTPGQLKIQPVHQSSGGPSNLDLNAKANLLAAFGQHSAKPDLTAATITGPLNAPDFDTVKKNQQLHNVNGHSHSRGHSPAGRRSVGPKTFIPTQILKREMPLPTLKKSPDIHETVVSLSPKIATNVATPHATAFKPQVLKRPLQDSSSAHVSVPVTVAGAAQNDFGNQTSPRVASVTPTFVSTASATQIPFDRRETLPADQKSTLLSLFGKPSQASTTSKSSSASPMPPQSLHQPPIGLPTLLSKSPLSRNPVQPTRSPQSPTPRSVMSGVISPVSPLPEKESQTDSPGHLASRSRISSIGEEMHSSSIAKQPIPTSHPAPQLAASVVQKDGLAPALTSDSSEARSPVDKNFLLGFLGDFASRGR